MHAWLLWPLVWFIKHLISDKQTFVMAAYMIAKLSSCEAAFCRVLSIIALPKIVIVVGAIRCVDGASAIRQILCDFINPSLIRLQTKKWFLFPQGCEVRLWQGTHIHLQDRQRHR